MANVMFSPKFHVDDSTGAPLDGGKVYFYAAGTSTPKDTYSAASAAPGTENANPLTLDARGEATVYGTGSYKVVVKDSLDNTIYTVDNYAISGTVVTADIDDGAVTTPKLAGNVLSADTDGRAKMQDGFVTSAKIDPSGIALPDGSTAATQADTDDSTKVATTAFVKSLAADASTVKAATDAEKYIPPANLKEYFGVIKKTMRFAGRSSDGSCSFVTNKGGTARAERKGSSFYRVLFSSSGSGDDMPNRDYSVLITIQTLNASGGIGQDGSTVGAWGDAISGTLSNVVNATVMQQDATGFVLKVEQASTPFDPAYINIIVTDDT